MSLVRYTLDDGGSVIVEVTARPGVERAGRRTPVELAQASFEQALAGVRDAATAALGQFKRMAVKPDEVTITFGVKLDAEAGALIARTGVEGHLEVKLTWRQDAAVTPDDAADDKNDTDP